MCELYEHVVKTVLPDESRRRELQSLLHTEMTNVSYKLAPLQEEWHDAMGDNMIHRGNVAHGLYTAFLEVRISRSYPSEVEPQPTPRTYGPDRLFSLTDLQRMSAEELLALVKDTPGALQNVAVAPSAVPRPLPPAEYVQPQAPAPVAAAFDNRLGTLPGQHGVPFIGKKRSGEDRKLRHSVTASTSS